MSHLDKLEVSRRIIDTARPRRKEDPVEYRRKKLIASLEEQLELALLSIEKRPLVLERKRGKQVVSVRPRLWWKTDDNEHVATQVRYNKQPLAIGRRGTTIEVGPLKKLPAVYRLLIRATKAGELDRAIEAALHRERMRT